MLKGIQLNLLWGPMVPVPASREIIEALTGVSVHSGAGEDSGFELEFALKKRSPLHTLFLLAGGSVPPILRVVIVVVVNGSPDVLIDGVITDHQVGAGENGEATLRVTGSDLTAVMNYQMFSGLPGMPFPAMPPEARVLMLVAKYAMLGVVPKIIPSVMMDVPVPTERIPVQQGTDLEYIRALADEVGYVFYMDPGPAPGMSFAYWGPEIKIGAPQPALNLDMDVFTNVESLSFRFDNSRSTLPIAYVQEPNSKATIPVTVGNMSLLNPPLGLIQPLPNGFETIDVTGKMSPARAALLAMARAARSSENVNGNGSLDVLRYGRVLHARSLVGVRGAGDAYDGLYYVRNVTHEIKRGQYKQNFSLSRNGLVSTVPRVPA
jgi:hypothetical protein